MACERKTTVGPWQCMCKTIVGLWHRKIDEFVS
ncbi:hypothetical protein F383_37093 [Gossypium arboreum]|uniref:Uncharacterized protein n=1 Tax=Gossypium arboreum TaxID=29729 RepID=A0A0B0MG15_GOSAR|nr:hypothetical protein F383_37093 [Gossypium arboreum]